jgi:hypothetical protein
VQPREQGKRVSMHGVRNECRSPEFQGAIFKVPGTLIQSRGQVP